MSGGSGLDWEVSYNGFSIFRLPRYYTVHCVLGSSNMGGDLAWVQVSDLLRHAVPRSTCEVPARENILHHNYKSHTFGSYS